jgi:prepilin-type N-terminal cleavage/methylation domain-containing protein
MPAMMTQRPITFSAARAAGFTLVELLLVLLLLSSLALVTTLIVDNADEQMRFEQTRTRLEMIRRAIVGDISRTLNGQPEISGFVADMGRLPVNIQELITPPTSEDAMWDITYFDIALSGVTPPSYSAGTLYGGWRGPYLDVMPESNSGQRVFTDGWGNTDLSGVTAGNDGWLFTPEVSGVTIGVAVQSYGADGQPGEEDEDNPYHRDYPADGVKLVGVSDWAVDLTGQAASIKLHGIPAGDQHNLKLQIYYLVDGLQRNFTSLDFSISGVVTPNAEIPLMFGSVESLLPMGTHAAVIVCSDGRVYDGSCSGSNTHPPYYFKLIPRAYTPPLTVEWTVQ